MAKLIQSIIYIALLIAGAIAWRWSVLDSSWQPLIYFAIFAGALLIATYIISKKYKRLVSE